MSSDVPKHVLVLAGEYRSIGLASDYIHRQLDAFLKHYNIPPSELNLSRDFKARVTIIGDRHRVIVEWPYWHKEKLHWPPLKGSG